MASSSRGGGALARGSSPISVASDDDEHDVESEVVAVADPGKAGDKYIEEYPKRRRVESELRNQIKVQMGRLVSRNSYPSSSSVSAGGPGLENGGGLGPQL